MSVDSYFSPVLYLMDGELHWNVEAVQNVASKHQCVLRGVDGMNPPLKTKSKNTIIILKYWNIERLNANSQGYKCCIVALVK